MKKDEEFCGFPVSGRTKRGLIRGGIYDFNDLLMKTDSDLMNIENFGKESLAEVKQMLIDQGLRDVDGPPYSVYLYADGTWGRFQTENLDGVLYRRAEI
jgi:hypothetical protein